MNDIILTKEYLPQTIEGLNKWRIIGNEILKAHKAKVRAADLTGTKEAKEAALSDAQNVADIMLDVDVRLGKLLEAIPREYPLGSPGQTKTLPTGISKAVSHQAQTLAQHSDIVEQVKESARVRGEIITPDKVYKIIKLGERKEERRELIAKIPQGKFAVILADPPWQYANSGFTESAESQYPTMPITEICAMSEQVNSWSTPETVLFLWATNPLLPDALKVMAVWGFEYKTNIAWIKDRGPSIGWYVQSRHELLLIGIRNNAPHPKEKPLSWIQLPHPGKHSQKPIEFYMIIKSMYDGPKIEMFCRNPKEGWESHGNEI